MPNKSALLVIDMQLDFVASEHDVLNTRIKKEINRAIVKNQHIIFLEYKGHGSTLKDLMSLTKNFDLVSVIKKDEDDGSPQISRWKKKHRSVNHFRVCGVNTSYCVADTVHGMCNKKIAKKIEVSIEGVNCENLGHVLKKNKKGVKALKEIFPKDVSFVK